MTTTFSSVVNSPKLFEIELKRQTLLNELKLLDEQEEAWCEQNLESIVLEMQALIAKFKIGRAVLFPKAAKVANKAANPPKYKDPTSEKTWSGVGNAPNFVKTALANGMKKSDLLIVKNEPITNFGSNVELGSAIAIARATDEAPASVHPLNTSVSPVYN